VIYAGLLGPDAGAKKDTSVHDVIIARAGPVGLFLACELRLAKLSVLVLEALEEPRSPTPEAVTRAAARWFATAGEHGSRS
jgi:2-polyprenyl-6-methoxyphenol hydroxylase-like FAD-dependent oxidoreductase